MGEDGSRLRISESCMISASRCSASFSGAVTGWGSECAVCRPARNDAKTRLAMDAVSGTTLRQPCAPGDAHISMYYTDASQNSVRTFDEVELGTVFRIDELLLHGQRGIRRKDLV